MADNKTVSIAVGTTVVGTDERTINGTPVDVQRVVVEGGSACATGQVAPGSTVGTLLAARDTRKSVTFVNQGTVNVFIGPATVTTANGFLLLPGASITVDTQVLLQAITPSGTGSVHYIETYDA